MKIELVSGSHVNGRQYYDVIFVIEGTEFTLVPVMYSTIDYRWYVKLPGRPLFSSVSYSELIDFLCNVIRELFKL